jgi:hypothetical protein
MAVQLFQIGNVPGLLEGIGIYQFILPFLLALAIFYGILRFAMPDKVEKSVIGLISLILAFFVMLFSSGNSWIVQFFATLGGSTLMVATGILVIIIFLGLFGIRAEKIFPKEGAGRWIFILFIIFIAIMIFLGAGAGWLISWPAMGTDFQAALIIIVIVALAMWWMTQGEKNAGGGGEEKKEG